MKLYAIKDKRANTFEQLWQNPNQATATREFADAVASEQTKFNKHPEDYELWQMGEYNQETGDISSKLKPIIQATACIEIKEK